MTIDELKHFCDEELNNINRILGELETVYTPAKTDYTLAEQAGIAALVINIYGGIEKTLKQILIYDKLDVEDSPEWHEKVLRKAAEIGIVPPDLSKVLSNYLAFRNFFIYSYIFNIKWDDMKALVDAIKGVADTFNTEVHEYIQTI